MVHVIKALTPPEGNFAPPSAIVVNGVPIQYVYYNGTLVRGPTGTVWPNKAVMKEDTWSVTSISDGGRIRYAAQGASGYVVIGLAYNVEVTKTKNELGLSGTISCNTDCSYSGWSYATQDGSTGNNLKQRGEVSQSTSVTNPSVTMNAITSGTTLPDYDGADKISSEIVASGSVDVAYEGTLLSGQASPIVDPTYTASWTRRVWISIPQANPYIQITAQEVSWKRDNTNILYDSTMRAQWSVKIKWAPNDFCDLTGTVVTFAVNGCVVADAGDVTIEKTISGGTTTSTYTLATSTGEETITLSCSWSDGAQGYDYSYISVPYAVRSKINAVVSDIPANATSSGSLAIAEKSSSIHSLAAYGSNDKWPSDWFDKTSLSDVSMIQFLQKASATNNVLIRAPKTITVDARIQITNPRITRSGTTLTFAWDNLIIPSITWGVESNLSFSQDMNLFVVMRIRNKSEKSRSYLHRIAVNGTSSGSLSNDTLGAGEVSCEEYASGEEGSSYTTISCYLYLNYVGWPTLPNVPLISAFETADELSANAALGSSGPVRYSSLSIKTDGGGATYVPQPLPDLSPSNASRPLWNGGLVIEGQPHPANTKPALLSMIFDKSSLAVPSLAFLGDVNNFASWQNGSYYPSTQELTLFQKPTTIVNMLSRRRAYAYLPIANTYDIMGVPSFTDLYIEVEFTTFIYGSWQTEPLGYLSCSVQFPLSTSALPFNYEPATGATITGGSPCILSLVDAPDDSTIRIYVQVHYTFPDISAFPNKSIAYADTIDVWSTAVALPTRQERATNAQRVIAAFDAVKASVQQILRGTDPDNPHRGQYRVEYRSN